MAFLYDLSDTWNASGTTFNAIKMDVTDTASAAASELIALQVGGTDKFTVRKDGFTDINGNLRLSASSATIELNTGGPQVYVPAANTFAIATGGGIGSPVERVRVDSSGNVGISTSSPAQKIHAANAGTTYIRAENTTSGVISDFGTNSTGTTILNRSDDPILFYTNTTERMRLTSTGLGIGTTSQIDYPLNLKADSNGKCLSFIETGAGTESWQLGVDTSGNFNFYDSTSNTPSITIQDTTGNVGIGTTSPSEKLSVYEATTSSSAIPAVNLSALAGSTNDRLPAINWSYGPSGTPVFASLDANRASSVGGNLLFHTATTAGTLTERMRVDSSGNVGIGTDSPATITSGITALSISDTGGKTTGDKIGELNFVTNDGSFTGTYSDGIGAAINAVSTSATGAAYALTFTTATTTGSNRAERLRIGETGNVGINDSSPSYTLDVNGQIATQDAYLLTANSSGTPSAGAFISRPASNTIAFGTASAERARVDSTGKLLLATTSTFDNVSFLKAQFLGGLATKIAGTGTTSQVSFFNDNGRVGYIGTSGTTTSYNTSSDARLKTNIADADDAAAVIDGIQVRKFDWKDGGDHQRYGMVAQELLEVAPEAVTGEPEGDEMMAVDYSKLVPMLVKEVQSLRKRVAELETSATTITFEGSE